MKVKITPSSCQGQIVIPPSKSMSHRAIICASLAAGESVISNVAYSDDIQVTIAGMRNLGAVIETFDTHLKIKGIKDFKGLKTNTIFCKESGSTLRFFIPIFSLCDKTICFTGENRLLKRPQKIYEDIFKSQGIPYHQDNEKIEIGGCLHSGEYTLDGSISSQFISGLLFTLPLLQEDSIIHIKEPYQSRSYVDLTIEMLALYGIEVTYCDQNTLLIKGNQTFKPCDYSIEGDYSQAAFFAVLASINHDIDLLGIKHDSQQGDRQIMDIITSFGSKVTAIKDGYHIQKGMLFPHQVDLQNCPDLGPILCILMMYTKGESRIYNAERLRYKESDRIASMEHELSKCGVSIKSDENSITIIGTNNYHASKELCGHKDHRIVMALSIAATVFDTPTIIEEAEYISKSYPSFFKDLAAIGIACEVYDE